MKERQGAKKSASQKPISVIVADTESESRGHLRALLEAEGNCIIIAEAKDSSEAYYKVTAMSPDVLVYTVGETSDLNHIQLIRKRCPAVGCIALVRCNECNTEQTMRVGAKVALRWNEISTKLNKAVRDVAISNKMIIGNGGSSRITTDYSKTSQPESDALAKLTYRELEIFNLIVKGLNNTQIAEQLSISRRTVELHRANLLRKLGLRNLHQQLIELAIKRGILKPR
jgi:DNA-binding NarL/FixJ family response regulator